MNEMVKKALGIAMDAHRGQLDKAGEPYIFHPLTVALSQETEAGFITALLHDVVEDSDYTIADLEAQGFSDEIIDALRLLTHDKSVEYGEYIAGLSGNPLAVSVKIADLNHNSDLTRLPTVTEKDRQRCEKYKKALAYLKPRV